MSESQAVCHDECVGDGIEQHAQLVAAQVLDDTELARVCARGSSVPVVDYRSSRHAVEVKELASPDLRSFSDAYNRHIGGPFPIHLEGVNKTWFASFDVSLAHNSFDRTGQDPDVKKMAKKLQPLLIQLEAKGLDNARFDEEIWLRVRELLHHDGDLTVAPPESAGAFDPGLAFLGSLSGQARTTEVEDDVVGFLQAWFSSGSSANARQSLAPEAPLVRCLVLVASMEGPAAAMMRTLAENPGITPQTALALPDEVDVVVLIAGSEVLAFRAATGWHRGPLKEA